MLARALHMAVIEHFQGTLCHPQWYFLFLIPNMASQNTLTHFAFEMCWALQLPTASCPLTFNPCIMTPTNTLMCMYFETAGTGKNSSHELGTGCSWQRAVLQHPSQFRCSASGAGYRAWGIHQLWQHFKECLAMLNPLHFR